MTQEYIGDELSLFEKAVNWKSYWGSFVRPYLGEKVLEVGAGLGGTTSLLLSTNQKEWLCVEPDPRLANQIVVAIEEKRLPSSCKVHVGTLDNLDGQHHGYYDSAIYIDVIEHIEDDRTELKNCLKFLKPGGYLMIIVPAHQWLYSPFDKAIGHYRRYNKKRLKSAIPADFKTVTIKYLDSVGLLASSANKLMLQQSYPTEKQIKLWDNLMVPPSKFLDKLTFHQVGKSLLGIFQKC